MSYVKQATVLFGRHYTTPMSDISEIEGMQVGDQVCNASGYTTDILGYTALDGDVIEATSNTTGVYVGNVPPGNKGPKGDKGDIGPQGPPGNDGTSINLQTGEYREPGSSKPLPDLPDFESVNIGDAYVVDDDAVDGQYDLYYCGSGGTDWSIINNWGGVPGQQGLPGAPGVSPVLTVLNGSSISIACTMEGLVSSDMTVSMTFTAYKGSVRIPATASVTNLPDGITTSLINGTTVTNGSIIFSIAADSDLSDILVSNGSIYVAITAGGVTDTKTVTWSKSIKGGLTNDDIPIGKKLLWSGNWTSGNIKVPGLQKYNLFLVKGNGVYNVVCSYDTDASDNILYLTGITAYHGGSFVSTRTIVATVNWSVDPTGETLSIYNGNVLPYTAIEHYQSQPHGAFNSQGGITAIYGFTTKGSTGDIIDTGWINASLQNGWKNYDGGAQIYSPVKYRKVGNIVYLRGVAVSGSMSRALFTLPAGFRISGNGVNSNMTYIIVAGTAAVGSVVEECTFYINSNGEVIPQYIRISPTPPGWVSVGGITFPADN